MIPKVNTIEEGLARLLTIRLRKVPEYTLIRKQGGEFADTLIYDGKKLPLFYSRFDCRIRHIASYGKKASENSALNVYSFVGNDISLDELMYKEFDIAEYVLHAKIEKVTAFVNKNAANMILVMDNGTCANIDLGNTLAAGAENQCQHRLITTHGMANDRAVGTMTVANQVNVYGVDSVYPVTYDDDEYYLFGLDGDEVSKVLTLHGIFTGIEDTSDWNEKDARFRAAIKAVYRSNQETRPIYIKEVLV